MTRQAVAACLSAGLLLAGCKTTVDGPAPPGPNTGTGTGTGTSGNKSSVTATVGGAADFAASGFNDVDGLHYTDADPTVAPARLIVRSRMSGRDITFVLVKFTGPGTYTLKADPNATIGTGQASYSENGLNGPFYYSQYLTPAGTVVGQVVVSSFDKAAKRVQGTFSFSGVVTSGSAKGQTKQVSNGKFDVYDVAFY